MRGLWLALTLAALAGWLAPAATAGIVHKYTGVSFNGSGAPAGPFSQFQLGADAVDRSSGDVYVLDFGQGVVDKFDSQGTYAQVQLAGTPAASFSFGFGQGGVAVDNSGGANAGDVYVSDTGNGAVDRFSSAGVFDCQITGSATAGAPECDASGSGLGGSISPMGVTVDASGDVFVADSSSDRVYEFGPGGDYIGPPGGIGDSNITSPGAIALSPSGTDLYVTNQFSNVVQYSLSGSSFSFDKALDSNGSTAVAVDPATGNVYVADNQPSEQIVEYDPTGNELDTFGPPNLGLADILGVATGAGGPVYTSDLFQGQVEIFTGDLIVPDVTTGQASSVTTTTATLAGTVNPDGTTITGCEFEYVNYADYTPNPTPPADPYSAGGTAPCASTPSGTTPAPVSANVTGLQPGTAYHFRLLATNTNGTTYGADGTFATSAPAFGVHSFSSTFTNQDGSPDTQAGSHPWEQTVSFALNTAQDTTSTVSPVGALKDVKVNLPAGFVGNPSATPRCSQVQIATAVVGENPCPVDTQVGIFTLVDLEGPAAPTQPNGDATLSAPLYNVVPPSGEVAQFGAQVAQDTILIDVSIRTGGDYGVTATISDASTLLPVIGSTVTLWGVPADSSHDDQRCTSQATQITGGYCLGAPGTDDGPTPSGAPDTPFLTMPSACSGPLTSTIQADSYQNPGTFASVSSSTQDASGHPVGIDGCGQLDFSPTVSVQPDTASADSPAGLDVDLHMPQDGLLSATGLAEASLKNAVVTLPAGVSVNPAAADGLQGCTPAEIGIDNANPVTCPNASALGSVEVDTPLLPDPLKGYVYQAQQTQNTFGSLLAIYVVAQGDGVLVKLAGNIHTDPVTGQVTATFQSNPQLPFTDFKLDFYGGSRAALATPEGCGTFTTTSDLTPWSSPSEADASPSDSFQINSGCVSGFAPSFTAGVQDAQAGGYSPFVLSLSRSDGDQNLSGLSVTLPPGMLAKLAGVQECSEQQLASISAQPGTGAAEATNPSCPASSQVGTVQTGAGVGPDPFFLSGKVYLTGPYKGAPYGVAVVVPAVAGPLDLGTVVVRQALYINSTTAQVTDVSDPFPTILDGIPLRIRRIDVTLNRPDFTLAPTSCDPMSVTGTVTSTGGLTSPVSSRFQVGGCSSLGFTPKLKMSLTGKGRTRSGDHPTLTATLTDPSGQANIRSAKVALPLSLALDTNNSQHVCNYYLAQDVTTGPAECPSSTLVGHATAYTPLLSQPLTGPVYLVQGIRFVNGQPIHTLPSLLVPLRGQIALDLRAQSSVSGGKLVTTFATIPDAPVSKFVLTITGGSKGLLVITGRGRTICGKSQVTDADFRAQSGTTMSSAITMGTPCARMTHTERHARQLQSHNRRGGSSDVTAVRP